MAQQILKSPELFLLLKACHAFPLLFTLKALHIVFTIVLIWYFFSLFFPFQKKKKKEGILQVVHKSLPF